MILHSKKVLVIGGSSGIGLSIAKACNDAGATVVISSRNEENLKSAADLIGNNCQCYVCDAHKAEDLELLFEDVKDIDHVVVSAGSPLAKSFDELTEKEAKADMDLNFWTKYNVSKQASTILPPDGSLLFISGAFSEKPNASLFMTSISVTAVESLVKNLVLSIGPIRVNAIAPYVIDSTDITKVSKNKSREQFLSSVKENLPAKHVGTGSDIGAAAVFLITNKYCNGAILSLDGGYTIA